MIDLLCGSYDWVLRRVIISVKEGLCLILCISLPCITMAQGDWATYRGTVTYRTDNSGVHPDAGAEVIVYYIDSVKSPSNSYARQHTDDSIANNSFLASLYYNQWLYSPIKRTRKQMIRKLKDLDAYPEAKMYALDSKAANIIWEREVAQYAAATADRNGRYSIKLRAGYYGVIVRSKHLKSPSRAEGNGNILFDRLEIKKGQTVTRNEEVL